ncbi:MAG TPA: trypsin-like peptidase domain-containing protein [Candidatus Dietzia intestinigallinarum]|nr:trypsin-like peptidase domain-containing protein [Candidatus Dietzia intestinigallinarum]
MENENGRVPGAPGSGDEWASGKGVGAGGHADRPTGPSPYAARNPYAPQSAQSPYAPQDYGPYAQAAPGGAPPPAGAQPTSAFPAAGGGPQTIAPGQSPETDRKSGRGMLVVGIVAAMLVSGGLGGWVGASVAGGSEGGLASPVSITQPEGQAPDGTVEAVADKVLPSVVSIDVRAQSGRGEGSGVVLTQDGMIITNNHVVGLADAGGQIQVRFDDGTKAPATIVGTDPATDIAVIKADTSKALTPISLGTSANLTEGQAVAAVGSPLGLSGTVTTGIVSALDRPVRAGGAQSDQSTVIDAIQTDAAVNPGNSGGALVNMNGELVGINSAIASLGQQNSGSIGLGFAIPVDQARRVADQLIKQGFATRAVLGVSISDTPAGDGALVRSVEAGGGADEAGIREGMVITAVGDRIIENGDALVAAIRSQTPGETVTVTYASGEGEQPTTVDVVLGEAR